MMGQKLLQVLSMVTLHGVRLGTIPLPALVALAGALPRRKHFQGPITSILDQVYRQLLKDFDSSRREDLDQFISETIDDQTLMLQLSSAGMDIFNTAVHRSSSVRYGCVVTQAPRPRLKTTLKLGISPSAQAVYGVYRALHELAAASDGSCLGPLDSSQRDALVEAFGSVPDGSANDAIVPTRSQVYGEVIQAAWADHHDVIGHFSDPTHDPPHVDWLGAHSGFDRRRFESMWRAIADFCRASESAA